MIEKLHNDHVNNLFQTMLKLRTIEECYMFFEDLCTVKEIKAMSTRLEAAKKLLAGKKYEEILNTVEISTATLSRVSKAIQYGDGGYKLIIEKGDLNEKY